MPVKERKYFKVEVDGEEIELGFKSPNQEELLGLDLEYRRVFSLCVRQGVISEAEARKIAEKNGVWGKEDEKRLTLVAAEVGLLETVIDNKHNNHSEDEIGTAIKKITEARTELFELINRKVETTSQSAEGLANQQRMHKFIQFCCVNKDDSRYFESANYVQFVQEYPDALSEIFKQAYYDQYGDPSKNSQDWAEVRYLRKKAEEAKKKEDEAKAAEEKPVEVVDKKDEVQTEVIEEIKVRRSNKKSTKVDAKTIEEPVLKE